MSRLVTEEEDGKKFTVGGVTGRRYPVREYPATREQLEAWIKEDAEEIAKWPGNFAMARMRARMIDENAQRLWRGEVK